MHRRIERGLALFGALVILIVGFDAVTFAATGSSLLLGRLNQAGGVTTIQNTGPGPALNLLTKSSASPPFTTNAKGVVPNLRASTADRLAGLTLAQVRAGAIPAAPRIHLVGQAGEPAFAVTGGMPASWGNYDAGFSTVAFRKDQWGVVHLTGLMCPDDSPGSSNCTLTLNTSGTVYFVPAFTLPAGYRPSSRIVFVVNNSDGFGRVDVSADGQVQIQIPEGRTLSFIALDGISFVATH